MIMRIIVALALCLLVSCMSHEPVAVAVSSESDAVELQKALKELNDESINSEIRVEVLGGNQSGTIEQLMIYRDAKLVSMVSLTLEESLKFTIHYIEQDPVVVEMRPMVSGVAIP